ncbi:hypothetical protein [Vibrio phage vB_VpaP_SJSY21]|nr:hypothetical protein [Vibrio phage vB_VpaP_SJSY21]
MFELFIAYILASIAYTIMQINGDPERAELMKVSYGENWKQYAMLLSPFIMGKAILQWFKEKVNNLPV